MAPQEGTGEVKLGQERIHTILAAAMEHVELVDGKKVYVGRRRKANKAFSHEVHPDRGPSIYAPSREYPYCDPRPAITGAFRDVIHASVGQLLDLNRRIVHPRIEDSKDVRTERNTIVKHLVEMRQAELEQDPEDDDVRDETALLLEDVIEQTKVYLYKDRGDLPSDAEEVAATIVMSALELAGALVGIDPSQVIEEETEG